MKEDTAEHIAYVLCNSYGDAPIQDIRPEKRDMAILARAHLALIGEFRKGVIAWKLPSAFDSQQGGDHYKNRGIQPVQFAFSNSLNCNCYSAVKYVTRHGEKGKALDLKKAIHFIQFELEQVYGIRSRIEYDVGRRPLMEDEPQDDPQRPRGSPTEGLMMDEHARDFTRRS